MSSPGWLLDSSALIALASADHESHETVNAWFAGSEGKFATCPITQGALIRVALHATAGKLSFSEVKKVLSTITQHPRHQFVSDDLSFEDIEGQRISGPQQVTDAYLAALARHHRMRLVTLDRSQAALYPDTVDLLT